MSKFKKVDGVWQLDTKEQMNRLVLLVQLLGDIPVQELLENLNHAHSVMPIVDPTAYRDGMGNLSWQEKILAKALLLQQVWEAVKSEAGIEEHQYPQPVSDSDA